MTLRQVHATLALDTVQHAADARAVAAALIASDQRIKEKLVMSPSPIRPYYAGAHWLMIPTYYTGDLEGLVTYDGVHERVRRWAPRAPSGLDTSDPRPDYLIFDRYADNRTLQADFGFDNQAFLATLRRSGFFVADRSRANYTKTTHSLASSLNLTHLELVPHCWTAWRPC